MLQRYARTSRKIFVESNQLVIQKYINLEDETKLEKEWLFPFRECSVKELITLRLNGTAHLIHKKNFSFFVSAFPKNISRVEIGIHLCNQCKRCRALPALNNGCDKVFESNYVTDSKKVQEILNCKRIEKYNYILEGFESINNSVPFFIVLKCALFVHD